MDLMLFTVYHVTKVFLKKESGFPRDSSTSALLLCHTEALGILVCYTTCAAALGLLHRAGKTQAILHFQFSQTRAKELSLPQGCATLGAAGRWKMHLFVSASKIL